MIIVLFFDGLRPDFVRPDLTPKLCEFISRGVYFNNHHAVYPSETRVNASSVATGCYPGTHGVVGNQILIPGATGLRTINTGNHEDLQLVERVQPLLSAPTLARVLKNHSKSYAIFSSGSPGSSWVQCGPGEGHMINVRGVVHPDGLQSEILNRFGAFPPEAIPATARNDYVMKMMLSAIEQRSYDVIFGWLCDPDLTQHKVGLGAEEALGSIRENDERLGALLSAARDSDVLVSSDHGFSTLSDPFDYEAVFTKGGFDLDQMVWTGSGIVLKERYKHKLGDLVGFLADQPWVGPLFTKGKSGEPRGHVPGTFSFDLAQVSHVRTPDVMFSRRWSDTQNGYGVPGFVYGAGGVASHGSCSPFDMHNVLAAGGPSFKKGLRSTLASGVVDISPTLQYLVLGEAKMNMDGRILVEGLAEGAEVPQSETKVYESESPLPGRFMQITRVGETSYIDKGWV
ncbi:MAG: alkaline phosphatase family protein [bacterium]|nr:alkaline phosphatase family protein [bacterium]